MESLEAKLKKLEEAIARMDELTSKILTQVEDSHLGKKEGLSSTPAPELRWLSSRHFTQITDSKKSKKSKKS